MPTTQAIPETHAIVRAIDQNNSVQLQKWLDQGWSPAATIKNKLKETLLDRAASQGADQVFEVLLKELKLQGHRIRLVDSRGTPLIVVLSSLAVTGQKRTGRYDRMATALVRFAPESLKLIDKAYVGDGRTALHQAAASGNVNLIRVFISNGAQVSARNTSGETPLHLACRFGHIDAVRYLIAAGADIQSKTHYTKATPLMAAAEMGHETVIRLLMAAGANKDQKDFFGKSAPQRYQEYSANFYTRMKRVKRTNSQNVVTPLNRPKI
jgi:ankyrin repeat protein